MVEKMKVNRFWKNITEFVKEKGMVIFFEKKGKFDKILLCFSCGNDKFIITFIFSTIFFDKFNDIFPKSIYFCLKMVEKMKVIMNLSFPHEKHNKILSNLPFFLQKNNHFL